MLVAPDESTRIRRLEHLSFDGIRPFYSWTFHCSGKVLVITPIGAKLDFGIRNDLYTQTTSLWV